MALLSSLFKKNRWLKKKRIGVSSSCRFLSPRHTASPVCTLLGSRLVLGGEVGLEFRRVEASIGSLFASASVCFKKGASLVMMFYITVMPCERGVCLPAGRVPQAHALPVGFWFSVDARSQVHCPAGRARHEQRGPSTAFSELALSQVQCRADCLPQEQVACLAESRVRVR